MGRADCPVSSLLSMRRLQGDKVGRKRSGKEGEEVKESLDSSNYTKHWGSSCRIRTMDKSKITENKLPGQ